MKIWLCKIFCFFSISHGKSLNGIDTVIGKKCVVQARYCDVCKTLWIESVESINE